MTDYVDYAAPGTVRTRGTVIVVPGRGESAASYARFGARVAADAYRVRVVAPIAGRADLDVAVDDLCHALTAAVAGLVHDGLTRPLVLVGADAGAATLGALLARSGPGAQWWPDAVVLAGLPGHVALGEGTWHSELDLRTHCPVHRGVLGDDPDVAPGSLSSALAADLLDAAYGSEAAVPHLLLTGDDDPLSDRTALAGLAKSLPAARLTVVHGAHHDVLNDLQHRSVAAEVVTYLEALRNGPTLTPILHVETSSW